MKLLKNKTMKYNNSFYLLLILSKLDIDVTPLFFSPFSLPMICLP